MSATLRDLWDDEIKETTETEETPFKIPDEVQNNVDKMQKAFPTWKKLKENLSTCTRLCLGLMLAIEEGQTGVVELLVDISTLNHIDHNAKLEKEKLGEKAYNLKNCYLILTLINLIVDKNVQIDNTTNLRNQDTILLVTKELFKGLNLLNKENETTTKESIAMVDTYISNKKYSEVFNAFCRMYYVKITEDNKYIWKRSEALNYLGDFS